MSAYSVASGLKAVGLAFGAKFKNFVDGQQWSERELYKVPQDPFQDPQFYILRIFLSHLYHV